MEGRARVGLGSTVGSGAIRVGVGSGTVGSGSDHAICLKIHVKPKQPPM